MKARKKTEERRAIGVIILFVFFLALPFINKAYHVDDTYFLYVADQIEEDPLRPYSFAFEWGGKSSLETRVENTPLIPYYIAFISRFSGRSESILHLSFIIFPLIAGLSFYFLSKRFIKWPLFATLILLSTATFLTNSHNLMLDVPMLSLFLLAAVLFIYGVDQNKHKLLLFGGVIAGFAYLAKPNAIIIIPLLVFYCFLKKKLKYGYYMAIPVLFIAVFSLHNFFIEDRILLSDYIPRLIESKNSSLEVLAAFFFSNLSYIGGATIFPFFFFYPFLLKKRNLIFFSISLSISGIISFLLYRASSDFISGQYTALQILLLLIFTSGSMFFIMLLIAENYKNAKSFFSKTNCDINAFFIFLWFIGVYILNSGILGGAVRYNTLLLPPLILSYFLLFRKYSRKINAVRFLYSILLFTALSGILVAYADFDYADSYRDFVENYPQEYQTADNTIWFLGHHGFQYYMEDRGYKILLKRDNSPREGDIIIKAITPSPRRMTNELKERISLIETIEYEGNIPVRVQNSEAHAGFYTYGSGFLPYSISNAPLEKFEIYNVIEDPR